MDNTPVKLFRSLPVSKFFAVLNIAANVYYEADNAAANNYEEVQAINPASSLQRHI